jgi:dTDP-4-amino-4,6-dideoxygalactose transaminase
MGHAAAFSCYPAKNLGAAGDAGILVTNDAQIAERVRAMRNCGQREKYVHVTTPYNHRLDTLQAAILRVKLRHLDAWNAARGEHAAQYSELLAGSSVVTPAAPSDTTPVWHLYVIRSEQRDALKDYLASRGIATGLHYPIPLHLQPYYAPLGYKVGDFPVTEAYARTILSLPMFAELSREDVEYTVQAIKQFALEAAPVI